MNSVFLVADDLTGAMDTGGLLISFGQKVRVAVNPQAAGAESPHLVESICVNAASRALCGAEARAVHKGIGEKVRGNSAFFIKKLDGGFRGNAAAEIEGLLDGAGREVCFVMSAIPSMKTYCLHGHQHVKDVILPKSMYADDPLHPPKESYIPAILRGGTNLSIAAVDIDDIRGDLAGAVNAHTADGARIIVLDCVTDEDCRRAVNTLSPLYPHALWAGTLGLVKAASSMLFATQTPPVYEARTIKCACFSASLYPATKAQIALSQQNGLPVITLDMDAVVENPHGNAARDAVEKCLSIGKRESFLLVQHLSPEKEYPGVEKLILQTLTACAKEICAGLAFDRLVIIGGETSNAILNALSVESVALTKMLEDPVSSGFLQGGSCDGWEFSAKGGSVGSVHALEKMLCRYAGD